MKFLKSILLAGMTVLISSTSLFANNAEIDQLRQETQQEIAQCFTDERLVVEGRLGEKRLQSETCHKFRDCVNRVLSSKMSQEEMSANLEKCRKDKDTTIEALLRSIGR